MSKSSEISNDVEALSSPFSRVYLCPQTEQSLNFTMCFKYPIDVEAFKRAFSNSNMLKLPRFCSLIVRNPNGKVHWQRTHVNIDDHFILHYPNDEEDEAAVSAFLAEIAVSTPLSENKPPWEIHVLVGLKHATLRVHHALGDGVSLMSMLSVCFGKNDDVIVKSNNVVDHKGETKVKDGNKLKKDEWNLKSIWLLMKSMWLTFVFVSRLVGRILWVKDKVSLLSGGDGVELWPRKSVTVKLKIKDFKSIKKAIPDATVNDVLLGVISYGLSKYLDAKSLKGLLESRQINGILVVNIRGSPNLEIQEMLELMRGSSANRGLSPWGNKTGIVLVPMTCCNGLHSLDHVKAMKANMDQKKHSYEARITHWFLNIIANYLSPKVASWICHRVLCNTTLLISNIMGPSKEIWIGDNPLMSMRANISAQPHAMTIHMVSYAGEAELQVMVAKDIISDPEFLVKCFEDSLVEMKNYTKIL